MTPNEALDSYMKSLDPKERVAKSRDIRAFCRISIAVLSDWRRGRTKISWIFQDKISEIVGKNIFNDVAD